MNKCDFEVHDISFKRSTAVIEAVDMRALMSH